MGQYDSSIRTAQRLIQKSGQATILRQFVVGSPPDATKPWRLPEPTTTDISVYAVFLDFGDFGERYMEGLELQTGDKLVLIAGSSLPTPTIRDRLYRLGGGAGDPGWAILDVKTLDPNGQVVLHQIQARH